MEGVRTFQNKGMREDREAYTKYNNILLYFQVNIPATTIIFSLLYESYTSYYIIYY